MKGAQFTSISWTTVGDQSLVLATCNQGLTEAEACGLVGTVVRVDGDPYIVHAASRPGGTVGSNEAFMLRVGKPS